MDRDTMIVVGAALAAVLGILLLSRARGSDQTIYVTGPTPETARDVIRAGTESQRIESQRETGLAGIYSNALVAITGIESRERIRSSELATTERVRERELQTAREVATIAGETARYQTKAITDVQQAKIGAEQQKNFFDTILNAVKIFVPFL